MQNWCCAPQFIPCQIPKETLTPFNFHEIWYKHGPHWETLSCQNLVHLSGLPLRYDHPYTNRLTCSWRVRKKFFFVLVKQICDWVWENQSYRPCQQIQFSSWTEWYMNKLLNFMIKTSYNQVICFSWLLFWSTVAICTSCLVSKWGLGQSWNGYEWLHSSVVLNKDVCYNFPFILASLNTCMVHNLA